MRRLGLIVLCLVVAGAAYAERGLWLPYAPRWLAEAMAATPPPNGEASRSAGEGNGGGGRRRGGGGGPRTVAVTTAKAESGSLPVVRHTIGYIRPLASTELAVETTGILSEITAKDGAMVKKGDLLARLDSRSAQAAVAKDQAALARDQATLDNAHANFDRVNRLVRSGATSTQAGEDADATVKTAEATVAVDRATLQADEVLLSKTEIRAPFDGRLGAFSLSLGSLVQPGTSVVGIAQVAPVYAEFTLPDTDLATVRKAMEDKVLKVEVRSSIAPESSPAETGPIVFIDNKIVEASASIALRAELDNRDLSLWPGQSIDVTVSAGAEGDVVVVPGVAIQPRETGSVAYVVGPDSRIEVRKVEVRLRDGERAGVASGLKPGDTVVVEGQVDLVDGTLVKPTDAPPAKTAEAGSAG